MKIYTKTGDKGETGLYGGERVAKDSLRVRVYGTVDEANAVIGMARAQLSDAALDEGLAVIQSQLFYVGADLATPEDSAYRSNIVPVGERDVATLEKHIDSLDNALEPLKNFILPGGHPAAASLHFGRTVVRRAERELAALARSEEVNPQIGVYLNRLSDLLFVMARVVNKNAGVSDTRWQLQARTEDV